MKTLVALLALVGCATTAIAEDGEASIVELSGTKGSSVTFGVDVISSLQLHDRKEFNQITFFVKNPFAHELTELTIANIGKPITIFVCNNEVSHPIVHSPIFGGGMALAGLESELAQQVFEVLSGRRSCESFD